MTMIKAVLLDLDNTLLYNPDEVFAAQYLRLVDEYFQARWQFPEVSNLLLQTIRAMAGTRDGQRTNTEVATEIIIQATGRPPSEVETAFAEFYLNAYPHLEAWVKPVGGIVPKLWSSLREKKFAVIIATNPLYPAEAIRQRLAWAGLPDNFDCYALVTHAENMHFVKPSPAYYAEIVARVGVEPDEAIMVGDSRTNDMIPAQQAGLHFYPIENSVQPRKSLSQNNTVTDFYGEIIRDGWAEGFSPLALTTDMIVWELRGNIGALFGTLADVEPHYWQQHPDRNEWSPMQIVCHLLESEGKVQRPRLERIVAENNPFLIAPPPPPGPKEAHPCGEDGFDVAHRFVQARQQTLEWLLTLPHEDWKRPGRHSVFGPTTLLEMAHFTAQHDRLHINQLCETLGRCQ